MKPDFVFIGPTKSGTTWIDSYLRERSEVRLPQTTKETFFFDKKYDRGFAWYEEQFGADAADKICIEVAPSLFGKPDATRRLASDLPEAKVICTVRNPVDRAVSHYFHYIKRGAPDVGFSAMCKQHPDIVQSGLYFKHLTRWKETLGSDRLILLSYDRMRSEPLEFCADVCRAIGINYVAPSDELLNSKVNAAAVPKHRYLAHVMWKGASALKSVGAHQFVSFVGTDRVKRLVFGPPADRSHRDRIREEAKAMSHLFEEDFEQYERVFAPSQLVGSRAAQASA